MNIDILQPTVKLQKFLSRFIFSKGSDKKSGEEGRESRL